jgi:hypothetical protein
LVDSCSPFEGAVSPVLLLLSSPCSANSSRGWESEDGCSLSVAEDSAVVSEVVVVDDAGFSGTCCESVTVDVSGSGSVAVVAAVVGSLAGAGPCWTVLETVGASDCVRSALTGVYAVCSELTISCVQD